MTAVDPWTDGRREDGCLSGISERLLWLGIARAHHCAGRRGHGVIAVDYGPYTTALNTPRYLAAAVDRKTRTTVPRLRHGLQTPKKREENRAGVSRRFVG